MKLLLRNDLHVRDRSYDVSIYEADPKTGYKRGDKIKITYGAYNVNEKCTAEMWNGHEWNNILTMYDLGERPDSSIYVMDPAHRRNKFEKELLPKVFEFIKAIVG